MFEEEKCPVCSWYDYDVKDYYDDFDDDGGIQVWKCICPNGHKFEITRSFKCTGVTVEQEDSGDS